MGRWASTGRSRREWWSTLPAARPERSCATVVKSLCMNRRHFLAGAAGAGLVLPSAFAASKKAIFELRYYRLRNTHANQVTRTSDFLEKAAVPALRRAGAGPLGFFSGVIAGDSPFILALVSFPSLSAMETAIEKMAADSAFGKAHDEYNAAPDLGYMRIENSLLRGFESMPRIEVPPV